MKDKKSVVAFSLASFFNDMGSDMIAPIWPLFVTTIIGASASLMGLLDGIAIAVVSISTGLAGFLSDKYQRRKLFITTGYTLSSISRLGYYLSTNYLMVIPFKVIDRMGKMREAPRDALLSELTDYKTRGRSFGLLRSMDSLGAVIGTIVTLLIINLVGIRNVMLIAVIPSILSVLVVWLFVKEVKGKVPYKGFSFKMTGELKYFLILMCFFTFFSLTYSFLVLLAKDSGFNEQNIILLYLLMNIFYSIFSYQFGKLSDKLGRTKLLIIGFILFSASCLLGIYKIIIPMFILFGLYLAVLDPVSKTLVSELAPKKQKGGIIGAYQMIIGLMAVPGGLFMGYLYDLNTTYPFIIGLITSMLTAVMMRKTYKTIN